MEDKICDVYHSLYLGPAAFQQRFVQSNMFYPSHLTENVTPAAHCCIVALTASLIKVYLLVRSKGYCFCWRA